MTKQFHPARRARAFTGLASAVVLVAMVAGFELSAKAETTAPSTAASRSRSAAVAKAPVAPAAPAAAPAAVADVPAPAAPAPAPAAPAPVVVAPPPAPVTPPSGTSGGSGG